jgi:hypothetical protein
MRLWTVLTILFVLGTSANAQTPLDALAKELPSCAVSSTYLGSLDFRLALTNTFL